jgi:hypothetical protein
MAERKKTTARRAPKRDEVFIAKDSGCAEVDGEIVTFTKGKTKIRSGHGLLRQMPDSFEPVEDALDYQDATR